MTKNDLVRIGLLCERPTVYPAPFRVKRSGVISHPLVDGHCVHVTNVIHDQCISNIDTNVAIDPPDKYAYERGLQ